MRYIEIIVRSRSEAAWQAGPVGTLTRTQRDFHPRPRIQRYHYNVVAML